MARAWFFRVVTAAATLLVLTLVLMQAGCNAPTLTALDQSSGPEHSLVMVQGSDLFLSNIIWDAGLGSEHVIPGGFLGGYMFSVPPGASLGNHPVAIENSAGRSSILNFNVTAPQPFGAPRIDNVMIVASNFGGGGQVSTWLYVQGANIDVGAVVQINGTDVASVAHKGLRNNLYGIPPNRLGYPIYHYVSVLAFPDLRPVGSTLSVTVRNLDAQTSAAFSYTLPADAAHLDSDGDSLLDSWETGGYDANGDGTIDVNLPALGATRYHKDVLLEVDVMSGLANPPIPTAGGNPGTFDMARAMFAAAPLINPGANNGINLILDTSGTVPFANIVGFTVADNPMLGTANYSTLKAANFDNANRGNIYHYAIWGSAQPGGFSGISDIVFDASGNVTGPGDDFIVSFDTFSASYQTLRSQVETLTHEFGHDLKQQHGGNNNNQYKPNYWSVMSYTWQIRTGASNAFRRQKVTCVPAYYATTGAAEVNGALPGSINAIVDYSEGMAFTLVENNNTLNEPNGVCGQPVDWNDDGDQTDVNFNANVDDDGNSTSTVTDFANWRALDFRGPATNGSVTP
jgi:hypothetical protein